MVLGSFDCALCHSFVRVPKGIYTVGQPVGNVEVASARFQIQEINNILDVVGESTEMLMRIRSISDLAFMSTNPELMKN